MTQEQRTEAFYKAGYITVTSWLGNFEAALERMGTTRVLALGNNITSVYAIKHPTHSAIQTAIEQRNHALVYAEEPLEDVEQAILVALANK